MSDTIICSMCGHDWCDLDLCPHLIEDYVAEIARLKAAIAHMQVELSNAMAERDEARAELEKAERVRFDRETRLITLAKELGRVQGERDSEFYEKLIFVKERDEAREWAKRLYRLVRQNDLWEVS